MTLKSCSRLALKFAVPLVSSDYTPWGLDVSASFQAAEGSSMQIAEIQRLAFQSQIIATL